MLISGIHPVTSEVNRSLKQIDKIFVSYETKNKRLHSLVQQITTLEYSVPLAYLSNAELTLMLGDAHHQGIIADISPNNIADEHALKHFLQTQEHRLSLVLDGITDTRNLGACLRSAQAFGVDSVIVPNAHSASINHTTYTASAGALSALNIFIVPNLARVLKLLKEHNYWVVGLDGYAHTDIRSYDFNGAHAIVMGSEGEGLRELTKKHCDTLVTIPMSGDMESLNISVAAGIALFSATS